jgi:hypothetical protein
MRNTMQDTNYSAADPGPTFGLGDPEWATRASTARILTWTSDRVFDDGDSHQKGEPSLCIGEAA